ncbi:MAG: hypothetical protein PHQ04_11570 [Opitutaceae bacterium]|nr:hypothetical protein [Opitutaceae bacterium]
MKESRFIELLNLYIDRQITPEEIVDLETEIQENPDRRRIYLQYCRMHHASRLVYQSFRDHVPETAAFAAGTRSGAIAPLMVQHRRRLRFRWMAYAGGLAAAACLTFLVARIVRNHSSQTAGASIVAQSQAPAGSRVEPDTGRMVAAVAPSPVIPETHPGPVSLRNGGAQEPAYVAASAILPQTLTVLNAPVPREQSLFDDGVFDAKAAVLPATTTGPVIYQGRSTFRQQAEFTGFQFQR